MKRQALPRTDNDLVAFVDRWDADIVTRRLRSLYRELTDPMRIKITEPAFWLGQERKPGDILDNQITGPFRIEAGAGGIKRIAQFVEMADENQQQTAQAAPLVDTGTAASAIQTPALIPPAAPAKTAPKANPIAARIRALTGRQAKFDDYAASLLDKGEAAMAKVETDGPAILERSVEAAQDKLTAITDLADSLKEMGNGAPSSGS